MDVCKVNDDEGGGEEEEEDDDACVYSCMYVCVFVCLCVRVWGSVCVCDFVMDAVDSPGWVFVWYLCTSIAS